MNIQSSSNLSGATKLFIAVATLYAVLVFFLPTNTASKASIGLSEVQYEFMLLGLRLPIILLLSLMFYAYRRMHRYSQSIADTPEGDHFATITKGLLLLVSGLLVISIFSAFINAYANTHPSFRGTSLIITNYLYLILSLVSLSYISSGAHRLTRTSNLMFKTKHLRVLMAVLVFFGVVFCYLISSRLQGSTAMNSFNAYYLPNILVWGTIVMPYLYAWFLGLFAAMELLLIARNTTGIIYRRALQYVAVGLVTLILSMVLLQYFRSVVPRTGRLSLGFTLFMVYGIYLFGSIGSLSIGRGAKRLQRIEEV